MLKPITGFLKVKNRLSKKRIILIFGKILVFLTVIIYGLWSFKAYEILHLFLASALNFYIGIYKQKIMPKFFRLFLLTGLIFLTLWLYAVNKILSEPLPFSLILLLLSAASLVFAYYGKSVLILLFSLIIIFGSVAAQALYLIDLKQMKEVAFFSVLIFISLIFYGLAKIQAKKDFKITYLAAGVMPISAILLLLSTKKGISYLNLMFKGGPFYDSLKMIFLFLVLFLVFMALLIYLVQQKKIFKKDVFFFLALFILFLVLPAVPDHKLIDPLGRSLLAKGFLWAFIFNVFLIIGVIRLALCIKNFNLKSS